MEKKDTLLLTVVFIVVLIVATLHSFAVEALLFQRILDAALVMIPLAGVILNLKFARPDKKNTTLYITISSLYLMVATSHLLKVILGGFPC